MKQLSESSVCFGRRLSPEEWAGYETTIAQAKQVLGKERLALISPIRSLPVEPEDTGMGSLLGAKRFFLFAKRLGFDTFQLDPAGKTKKSDASPYTGTVFSLNPLYVYLAPLAQDEKWCGVLPADTLAGIIQNAPQDLIRQNKVPYRYLYDAQEEALQLAYQNFSRKLANLKTLTPEEARRVEELNRRFEAYVANNKAWLEPDALYEALTREYGNDYWPNWQGPQAKLDKRLLHPHPDDKEAAQARRADLEQRHRDTIRAYAFTQFVWHEQKDEFLRFAQANGIGIMADRQVGLSDRDIWAYQPLFLKDYALGCPPDYFSETGQDWGFPVLDPDKLFNPDGSLAQGGLLLKTLFEKILADFPGGFRIDHIIGLIDPWVYPQGNTNTSSKHGGSRLYSSPEHLVLSRYAHIQQADLDPDKDPEDPERVLMDALTPEKIRRYAAIIEKIILPVIEAKGLSKTALIAEDLGTLTNPVTQVMKQLGLSGIRVTQFVEPGKPDDIFRGKNVLPQYWITDGTHDNVSTYQWAQNLKPEEREAHARILAEDLIPESEERPGFVERITNDLRAFVQAKTVELFASPARNIQVFFTNWLGMDTTYNAPGTCDDSRNWSLRIPRDVETYYFEQVRKNKAINLPEVMKLAMEAKGQGFVQANLDLVQRLEHYARLLKQ